VQKQERCPTHVSTIQHCQTSSIQVQVMTSHFSKMPLKMTFNLENDLETQYWLHKWNPCPLKHWKNWYYTRFCANRGRNIPFTFIGGGHIGFCENGPLEGHLNLFAMVFENLVSIPITMQNFNNWSQSARFCLILMYSSPLYLKNFADVVHTKQNVVSKYHRHNETKFLTPCRAIQLHFC